MKRDLPATERGLRRNQLWNSSKFPGRGIKPAFPALEVWHLNHWTTGEVPDSSFLNALSCFNTSRPSKSFLEDDTFKEGDSVISVFSY